MTSSLILHYYEMELMPHSMDFPGNNSRIIHSENIYYVPGKVLGAGATKKEREKRMWSLPSRTWSSHGSGKRMGTRDGRNASQCSVN